MNFIPAVWKSQSFWSRCHVLAWTSAWSGVPFTIWLQNFDINNIILKDFMAPALLISSTVSFIHWKNNRRGSFLHKLDVFIAGGLIIYLAIELFLISRISAILLISTVLFFFALQRYMQNHHYGLGQVTLIHAIYRYFAFWLAMAVYAQMSMIISAILTIVYIYHVYWLALRDKNSIFSLNDLMRSFASLIIISACVFN